jgi:hypothetical protein
MIKYDKETWGSSGDRRTRCCALLPPERHNANAETPRTLAFCSRRRFGFPVHALSFPVQKIIIMLHGQLGPAAAAPFSEQILPAFDGQLEIRIAYSWSRDTVLTPNAYL